MHKDRKLNNINQFEKDFAESVSFNEDIARDYLEENGVDIDKFIKKGLNQIQASFKKKEMQLSKALFFKRVVLGAEIVYKLHNERTFGHVKFMKLMYLCEQVSNMELAVRYVKQAAGPFDARFMHSIDKEFIRLKWFDVKVNSGRKFNTYKYIPDEKIMSYKTYYNKYYCNDNKGIEWLIKTFGKPPTKKVELVATIYSCLDEFIKKNEEFSTEILIEKVFDWSVEKKKKFTRANIVSAHNWMIENRLIPVS
ncbi:hypothetical protein SAMN05428642_10391 [Flaviramulus basaltis]|uniref:Uncharacterized protein n=1 Tax=Flaviramulus basaltis TaxID=369401 RepID=A0A1K2ILN6_9FLAO|nr:hypothetical protein [Flaviramulus basaltis]SFZ93364.1 hypothetical protein SAMN05428642_10391 [Flaviramulus basaltis]